MELSGASLGILKSAKTSLLRDRPEGLQESCAGTVSFGGHGLNVTVEASEVSAI